MKIQHIICFSLLISTLSWAEPTLTLLSPSHNLITSKNKVLLKGKTTELKQLKINGTLIPLQPNGRFYHKETLTKPNRYHVFKIEGIATGNITITQDVKVFYKVVDGPQVLPSKLKLYPKDNTIRDKSELTITGQATNIPNLTIDNKPVTVKADGTFRKTIKLNPGKNVIQITGKNNNSPVIKEQRTYYYTPKTINNPEKAHTTPTQKPKEEQKKSVQIKTYKATDLMTESTQKVLELYEKYNWEIQPPTKEQQLIIGKNSTLMNKENSLIVVIPLENKTLDIYKKSQTIADYLKRDSMEKNKSITLLWINQKFDTLELHYDGRKTIEKPFLVLLKDQEIKLNKRSKAETKALNTFTQRPFGI